MKVGGCGVIKWKLIRRPKKKCVDFDFGVL
jgi:hypothetical protein